MKGHRLLTRCLLTIAIGLIAVAPLRAAVLALAPTDDGDAVHVVDTQTLNATLQQADACCAVQVGSVTADTVNHRVFFVSNNDDGSADLYAFSYDASMAISSVPITAGARISQLHYDSVRGRLVAVISNDDDSISIGEVNPATGTVTTLSLLGPDCCKLRAGVAAYDPGANMLYAVGRRSSDTDDQILAFSGATGALTQNGSTGGLQVSQLIVDSGSIYALNHHPLTNTMALELVTTSPGIAITPVGSDFVECCFASTGAATIDHVNNAFVALVRSTTSAAPFALMSFSLSSGVATSGNIVPAMGLFEDTAVLSDRIFADGFDDA
jgi:hypothetical protein